MIPVIWQRGARWLALALTVLVSAELTARIEDYLRLDVSFVAAPSDEDLVVRDEFGTHGRPNARYKKWHLNRFGFRSPDMTPAPRPGCKRVMVLGASESFGLYESEGNEYPAQLSAALNRHDCHEVVNAAIAGMTVRSIASFWDHWASRFKPAIVIIYPTPAFYVGDRRPADSPLPGPVPETVAEPVRWWLPRMLDRARDVIEIPALIQRRRVRAWLQEARAGRPASWLFETVPQQRLADFLSDVELLVCKIESTGARPLVVTHANAFHNPPLPEEYDALESWNAFSPRATSATLLNFERAAAKGVMELANRHGIMAVDAAANMYGRRDWFAGDHFHFSDEGAHVLAELIATQVVGRPPETSVSRNDGCGAEHADALQ